MTGFNAIQPYLLQPSSIPGKDSSIGLISAQQPFNISKALDTVHFGQTTAPKTTTKSKTWGERLRNFFIFDPAIRLIAFLAVFVPISKVFYRLRDTLGFGYMPEKEIKQYIGTFHPVSFPSVEKKANGKPLMLKGFWVNGNEKGKKDNQHKTIVFGHGFTQNWKAMVGIAKPFIDEGYNVFFINFRAHGQSDGWRTNFGFAEGRDLAGAIDWVKKNHGNESKTLIYHGSSLGANALMFSSKSLTAEQAKALNQNIDAVILDSPTDQLARFVSRISINLIENKPLSRFTLRVFRFLNPEKVQKKFAARMLELFQRKGPSYLRMKTDVSREDTMKLFKDNPLSQKPILFIHGTNDEVITWKDHELPGEAKVEGAKTRYESLQKRNQDKDYKNVSIAELTDQGHNSTSWQPYLNDPKNPRNNKYWSTLRGGDLYLKPIHTFLENLPSG